MKTRTILTPPSLKTILEVVPKKRFKINIWVVRKILIYLCTFCLTNSYFTPVSFPTLGGGGRLGREALSYPSSFSLVLLARTVDIGWTSPAFQPGTCVVAEKSSSGAVPGARGGGTPCGVREA